MESVPDDSYIYYFVTVILSLLMPKGIKNPEDEIEWKPNYLK